MLDISSIFRKQNRLLLTTIFLSLLFFIVVGFDLLPFLRGPAPYPPEWQWAYFFVNTFPKIYAPIFFIIIIVTLFYLQEKKVKKIKTFPMLAIFVLLFFFFQLSVMFFSRSGLFVLIHRIINPEINGYFTAALSVQNPLNFLGAYNELFLNFVYHAKAHPPGAILLFYVFKQLMELFPFFGTFFSQFNPSHADVRLAWSHLSSLEKSTAVFGAFFIPFLSSLTLLPLYYAGKTLYDSKIALRSILLFLFFPNTILFTPINDAFLHIFTALALFFIAYGMKKNKNYGYFFSGIFLFMGVFFNLSFLPLLIFFFFFYYFHFLISSKPSQMLFVTRGISFVGGFLTLPVLLFVFLHFNFLKMIQLIMASVPDVHTRSYVLWTYFNLQDFLLFCGIPIAIILILVAKQQTFLLFKKMFIKCNPLALAFLLMVVILNFSGSSRGEVSRIWLPFMPIVALIAASFLTKEKKYPTNFFIIIFCLQAIQILVMQEFWVTLW